MRWRTHNSWRAGMAGVALLLILLSIVWLSASVAGAHQKVLGLATAGTVTVQQATPTEDATMTALNKEKLAQEVDQQQRTLVNWVWSNAATLLSAILSTFVVVIGALFGFRRWRVDRRDTENKELEDRAEARFQAAVAGLGDDKESARIGAAILLRTFLREEQGYEQFYVQTFDLAVANLRLPRRLTPPDDPDGLPHPPEHPNDTPLPLTTLSQALVVAFKEAFPLAREWLTKQHSGFTPQALDATDIQLDNAYLSRTDLKFAWMPKASMRAADLSEAKLSEANLFGANLIEANLRRANLIEANLRVADLRRAHLFGADLSRADLSGADLSEAHLSGADLSGAHLSGADLSEADLSIADLRGAKLYGVRGLTREQLEACKTQGAILEEEDYTTS